MFDVLRMVARTAADRAKVYGMLADYGVGHLARFALPRRRTLSIEIGMQNAGMGTVLAPPHFGERATVSTAVFVYMCILSASVIAHV